ncbi:MAG: cbb3-type cytochrome c oxidase subunit II [Verrucomicrobiota bacterium]
MNLKTFYFGLTLTFGLPWLLFIVFPHFGFSGLAPVAYEIEEEALQSVYPARTMAVVEGGSRVYAQEGCFQCHTQVIRPEYAGTDTWREGWAGSLEEGTIRTTRPRDYLGESYAHFGVQRLGPDLSNVGLRIQDRAWHYRHLYDPRSEVEWSSMPGFRHLFQKRKIQGQPSSEALRFPGELQPEDGFEIVPTERAVALVDYLLALRKDQPIPASLLDSTTLAAQTSE